MTAPPCLPSSDTIMLTFPARFALLLLLTLSPPLPAAKGKQKLVTVPPTPASSSPQAATLRIAYLGQPTGTPPLRPYFDPAPAEAGLQGARLGLMDDNTTGRFIGQKFELKEVTVPADGDILSAFKALLAEGYRYFLLNLQGPQILQLATLPEAQDSLLFNVASTDDRLRTADCKANVLHLLPSDAMKADALAQYLAKKRWKKWLLTRGATDEDQRLADALRHAAGKFGHKISAEKTWQYGFEDRRTPESEVPVFTQQAEHDVVVVADASLVFGDFIPYRTWLPRPVVGTVGLKPTAWDRTHEAWGALQLQNRFRELAGRTMTEVDYGAWLAARAIGEAATRTKSIELEANRPFLLSEQFSLAGFKGVPLSFRPWDHQLRQPVLLTTDRSLVAVAPIEGYLHPKNELDTLGTDEPETSCRF